MLEVDGKKAGDTGIYPQVNVQYRWKVCNFDGFVQDYAVQLLDDPRQSYFKLWNSQNKDLFQEKLDSSMALKSVESGENCEFKIQNGILDTSISNWFISAQLEGYPTIKGERPDDLPYCYAYAFTPIRVIYGPCTMSVSLLSCRGILLLLLSNLIFHCPLS